MVNKKISIILFLAFCLSTTSILAQLASGSLGNIYIKSNTSIGLLSDHNFGYTMNGQGGIINTNRNSSPGVLVFARNATWTNAGDMQHVDGYVKIQNDDPFVFPIGDLGFYKPLAISGASGTTAAYYLDNPNRLNNPAANSTDLDYTISDVEYWHIKGTKATHVTLYFDSNSDIESLVGEDLSDLKIFGWNGQNWEMIPSNLESNVINTGTSGFDMTANEVSLAGGNITTSAPIIPDDYQYLTFGIEKRNGELAELEYTPEYINDEVIEFTLFPNPTFDLGEMKIDYNLKNLKSDAFLFVYDASGSVVLKHKLERNKDLLAIPVTENTSGLYHVGIITESGSKDFHRVLVTPK